MTRSTTRPIRHLPLDVDVRHAGEDRRLSSRVARQLLKLIAQHYSPHLRLPPIRQIADDLSVSVGTANQAIKQLVSEGILIARPRSGTLIAPGCTLEHIQQRLEGSSDDVFLPVLIRVLLAPNCDTMVQEMADSFARATVGRGARVVFAAYPGKSSSHPLNPDGCDAIAMFQPPTSWNSLKWSGSVPLVVASTSMRDIQADGDFDQIAADEEHGAYLAGRRFRETGHRRVCYIGRQDKFTDEPKYDAIAQRRLDGFERGWGEPIPDIYRIFSGSRDLHHGAIAFGDYMALSTRPQGVFCETDDLAIGFHIGAFTHDMRAGRDFSLIGFDKQQLGLTIPTGPLTTVEAPRQTIGERAAELLLDRIKDPDQPVRRIALGCTLFEGKTLVDYRKEQSNDRG